MRSEQVLEEVTAKLMEMRGFRSLQLIDADHRDEIMAKEREAERAAREEGLMDVRNEGFWATFERDRQIALVLEEGAEFLSRTNELLQLRDQEGNMLGEWVNEDKAQELSGRQDVKFVSKDFILYGGLQMKGEPYFIVPEVGFPFLRGAKGIDNVTSCSPSLPTDAYIRNWLGLSGPGMLSHIVGFDIEGGK